MKCQYTPPWELTSHESRRHTYCILKFRVHQEIVIKKAARIQLFPPKYLIHQYLYLNYSRLHVYTHCVVLILNIIL